MGPTPSEPAGTPIRTTPPTPAVIARPPGRVIGRKSLRRVGPQLLRGKRAAHLRGRPVSPPLRQDQRPKDRCLPQEALVENFLALASGPALWRLRNSPKHSNRVQSRLGLGAQRFEEARDAVRCQRAELRIEADIPAFGTVVELPVEHLLRGWEYLAQEHRLTPGGWPTMMSGVQPRLAQLDSPLRRRPAPIEIRLSPGCRSKMPRVEPYDGFQRRSGMPRISRPVCEAMTGTHDSARPSRGR